MIRNDSATEQWRKSTQYLMPAEKPSGLDESYDIYPAHKTDDGTINEGLRSLAQRLVSFRVVAIDGFQGVFFDQIGKEIAEHLQRSGRNPWIHYTADSFRSTGDIDTMVAPFTGGDDPLFGRRTTLTLRDFIDEDKMPAPEPGDACDIIIIIGPGASLLCNYDFLVYIDLPKNELQFRARAGSVTNLGAAGPYDPKVMYKRFYFVDWIVLNNHKKSIIGKADIVVDGQRRDNPCWMTCDSMRKALREMSCNLFRVRPWFEPGAWGGTWIINHIRNLSQEVPNYAWSFELIVPENGLLIESSSLLFEISFDTLMFLEGEAVLGDCYDRFGCEFPIRFDFLDTFDGGNLSLQCHPQPEYTLMHFGESFTQEETYYILDTKDSAAVYLGFTEESDPESFERELLDSYNNKTPFDAEKHIRKLPAAKHDLFLIPYGTIHGSGRNNLVLEISSTPYIFTFKMYDWLRLDLDGRPRPLNIERGMSNLYFDRKGSYVTDKLVAHPVLLDTGNDWQLWHMPTHETHLYDVHRYRFKTVIEIETGNKCLVMSLVEGQKIKVTTKNGLCRTFSYAETFVIPAAAGKVSISNLTDDYVMLIKAFVKTEKR